MAPICKNANIISEVKKRTGITMKKNFYYSKAIVLAGIIFIAFNISTPSAAVGSLIDYIRADLGMSHVAVSLINTITISVIACFSPIASKIGAKTGLEKTLFGGLFLILIGLLTRASGSVAALFAGTVVLGMGISVGNTITPSIIKKNFPEKVDVISGIYTTAISGCAALASAVCVPLCTGLNLGWNKALAVWGIFAAAAIVLWIPQILKKNGDKASSDGSSSMGAAEKAAVTFIQLLKNPLAWCVALFYGFQSFDFNGLVTWLSPVLKSYGYDSYTSGFMLSYFQIVSMPASLITPLLFRKFKDQKVIGGVSGGLFVLGIIGLIFGGSKPLMFVWLTLMGLGSGATFALAISFMAMRAAHVKNVAMLTGMSQLIGSLIGALGPFTAGLLYDLTSSWVLTLLLFLLVTAGLAITGILAGRNAYIDEPKR